MLKQICPKCNKEYTSRSAISRIDNKTRICPACGVIEAIENIIENNKRSKRKKKLVRLVY